MDARWRMMPSRSRFNKVRQNPANRNNSLDPVRGRLAPQWGGVARATRKRSSTDQPTFTRYPKSVRVPAKKPGSILLKENRRQDLLLVQPKKTKPNPSQAKAHGNRAQIG